MISRRLTLPENGSRSSVSIERLRRGRDRWGGRIGVAWLTGCVASALGLMASYRWNLPSGPAIVCALGLVLILFTGWRHLKRSG